MAVVKLNEAMLLRMGFDRVAVEAFRHLFAQVGSDTATADLTKIVNDISLLYNKFDSFGFDPPSQPSLPFEPLFSNQSPPPQEAQQATEYLETQVRMLQDEVALLRRDINDIRQGVLI